MMDAPCGDANWQFDAWETDGLLRAYVGLDAVRPVVELDARRFCHHSNKRFVPWDLTACGNLPKLVLPVLDGKGNASETVPVDMVHVRDVIQHMPLAKGLAALRNVARSEAKYLVATTFPRSTNRDIKEGDMYQNNLCAEPFNLPQPRHCTPTHPEHESDDTCLWKINTAFKAALGV